MKQCPNCRTTYTDDTLSFCLSDGTPLQMAGGTPQTSDPTVVLERPGSEPTVVLERPGSEPTVVMSHPTADRPSQAAPAPPAAKSGGMAKWIVAASLLGVALLLLGAGIIGFLYYNSSRTDGTVVANAAPNARPSRSLAPDRSPDTVAQPNSNSASNTDTTQDDFEKALANLNKALGNIKTDSDSNSSDVPDLSGPFKGKVTSPKDGFLALRNMPSTKIGKVLVKIPNGAIVDVTVCGARSTEDGRSGRWCLAEYGGEAGWIFDAWLVRQ